MDYDEIVKDYLKVAQELYGPMVNEWNYSGIEFNNMVPHLRYFSDTGNLVVSLSQKARNDNVQFHFQLSHEICHMLYPTMDRVTNINKPTTVLNEGLSTYFSLLAIENLCNVQEVISNLEEYSNNYYQAFLLVAQLHQIDQGAVKKLRSIQPMLNELKEEDFEYAGLKIPKELVKQLLTVFK